MLRKILIILGILLTVATALFSWKLLPTKDHDPALLVGKWKFLRSQILPTSSPSTRLDFKDAELEFRADGTYEWSGPPEYFAGTTYVVQGELILTRSLNTVADGETVEASQGPVSRSGFWIGNKNTLVLTTEKRARLWLRRMLE